MRAEQLGEVIVASQLQAAAPVDKIRKLTNMRSHSVRYWLNRGLDLGVIQRRCFMNMFRLGYTQHQIYISLATGSRERRQAVVERLIQSTMVTWLGRLGGDYQYGANIISNNLAEVFDLFHSISEEFGHILLEKAIAVRVALTLLGSKYLAPHIDPGEPLSYRITTEYIETDELDRKLLRAVTNDASQSTHQIARNLAIPQSTVDYRLKKLVENGVIVGHYYAVLPEKVGMHSFLLLLCSKGISNELRQELYNFCVEHPNVTIFIEAIGNWDFEMVFEVEHSEQATIIMEELQDAFGDKLHWIKMLPLFSYLKLAEYPF